MVKPHSKHAFFEYGTPELISNCSTDNTTGYRCPVRSQVIVTYLIEAGYDYHNWLNPHNSYNQEDWIVGSTQTS